MHGDCKRKLIQSESADQLIEMGMKSNDYRQLKNLNTSVTILLCECGFESLEEKVQTQIQIVASKIKDEENEGKKVQLSEKVKRMEYWHQKFVSLVPLYRKHSESVSKLKDSEF